MYRHLLFALFLVGFGEHSVCFLNIEELNELHYALDINKNPVNEVEVDWTEGLKLSSKHGQSYFCKLPDTARKMAEHADPQESRLPVDYPIPMLLQPLKLDACLKKVKGWWTYELCFGKTVRQYHSDDGITHGDAIDLGLYEADFDWNDEEKLKQSPFRHRKMQKYHSQTYMNGTKCDIHNHHRETEVRYYCDESANVAFIDRVDEPSTCSYVIIVKTSLLCSHPHTRLLSVAKGVDVVCQPLLTESKYQHYQEQQERKSKEAQKLMNEKIVERHHRMKDYVEELQNSLLLNNPFASMQSSILPPKVLSEVSDVEASEAKEVALDFISRFVEESRLNKLSSEVQKRLHKTITDSVLRLNRLPSADMARLLEIEISTFLDAQELLSEDNLFNAFQSLGLSSFRDLGSLGNFGTEKSDKAEHIKVKVRHIDAEVGEVDEENEQDPTIQQLEQEIGKELAEAGYSTTDKIEVHFITNTDTKESFHMTKEQAQHFKEMLLEVVGGVSLEDNERRRYNRLIENYNLKFHSENEDIISTATDADEAS